MSMFPAKQHWRWTSQPLLSPNQGSHTCPWRCTETTLSLSLAPAFATPGGVHTLSFPFCRTVQVAGSLVPQPESEPKPQEWKPQALTTGPPGNSWGPSGIWTWNMTTPEPAVPNLSPFPRRGGMIFPDAWLSLFLFNKHSAFMSIKEKSKSQ